MSGLALCLVDIPLSQASRHLYNQVSIDVWLCSLAGWLSDPSASVEITKYRSMSGFASWLIGTSTD